MAKDIIYRFSIFFSSREDITKSYYFGDFEIIASSEGNATSRVSLICNGLMVTDSDHIYYYKLLV
ncbi:hypothetical protein [Butyricimonas paravirosa]|jgi:hypothetical protein|uniref:hypothetical protein n=1 Tax=Butyricimonas paravirosa TaxID=1472417 RepID=UPI00351FE60F